jgi:hypothetical protein
MRIQPRSIPTRPNRAAPLTRRGGCAPTPCPSARKMRLLSFKPLIKNSLRGFGELELASGLRLIDCPVLVSHGKAWVALPSKSMVDQNGQQKRDPNGKPAYVPVVQWRDRDLQDRFSAAAIELIRAAHPQALDGATP